jgi:hypothetical protein
MKRRNKASTPKRRRPKRPADRSGWRPRGNIAQLSKADRDKVNQMLLDGFTYDQIINSLGEAGKGLTRSNLTHWKNGAHKDWLAEQAFIESTRVRQETPAQLVRDFDATQINHAALQLGTLHIFDALRQLRPGSLDKRLGGDCAAFARLLNALARASRETMLLQKYRDACARARAALEPMKDPRRKLTESERRAIVLQVDDILGLRSNDDDLPPSVPNATPSNAQPAAAHNGNASSAPAPSTSAEPQVTPAPGDSASAPTS